MRRGHCGRRLIGPGRDAAPPGHLRRLGNARPWKKPLVRGPHRPAAVIPISAPARSSGAARAARRAAAAVRARGAWLWHVKAGCSAPHQAGQVHATEPAGNRQPHPAMDLERRSVGIRNSVRLRGAGRPPAGAAAPATPTSGAIHCGVFFPGVAIRAMLGDNSRQPWVRKLPAGRVKPMHLRHRRISGDSTPASSMVRATGALLSTIRLVRRPTAPHLYCLRGSRRAHASARHPGGAVTGWGLIESSAGDRCRCGNSSRRAAA